jgi:hypothetical protein
VTRSQNPDGKAEDVVIAARTFVIARQSFIRIHTSKVGGRTAQLARQRRDNAINDLVAAVEELDA